MWTSYSWFEHFRVLVMNYSWFGYFHLLQLVMWTIHDMEILVFWLCTMCDLEIFVFWSCELFATCTWKFFALWSCKLFATCTCKFSHFGHVNYLWRVHVNFLTMVMCIICESWCANIGIIVVWTTQYSRCGNLHILVMCTIRDVDIFAFWSCDLFVMWIFSYYQNFCMVNNGINSVQLIFMSGYFRDHVLNFLLLQQVLLLFYHSKLNKKTK